MKKSNFTLFLIIIYFSLMLSVMPNNILNDIIICENDNDQDNSIENNLHSSYKTSYRTENLTMIMNISASGSYASEYPKVAVDSNDIIHIVWEEKNGSSNNYEIFYRFYNNTNDSLSPIYNVSQNIGVDSEEPDITVDKNNNIHVVWQEDNVIKYRNYSFSTETWQGIRTIYTGPAGQETPEISINSTGDLMALWISEIDASSTVNPEDADIALASEPLRQPVNWKRARINRKRDDIDIVDKNFLLMKASSRNRHW